MDHVLENKFLNKEQSYFKVYSEKVQDVITTYSAGSIEAAQFQVFESFVKEKVSLIKYVNELVIFSAKLQAIEPSKFLSEEIIQQERIVKSEQDAFNIKNRIIIIFEKYQEQSAILDSIIDPIVTPIMLYLRSYIKQALSGNNYTIPKDVSHLFELVNWLSKVRGFKTVIKFFPHEVADLEPVVEMLHFQDTEQWWIAYILILWLSIIVLVPFDIESIDSKKEQEILVKRIINIGKSHLSNSGKIREASALLLAKLLTRPDVIKSGETDIILNQLAVEYLQGRDDGNQMFLITGILQTLVEIFKVGHRVDLLPRINTVFDPLLKTEIKNKFMNKSTLLRKLRVKLAQRIGLIFLKPKVTKWRYQRGFRSLQENLAKTSLSDQQKQLQSEHQEDEDMLEEDDINFDQLEHIIQFLLESLKDEDNVVRWTSAKGLGRITGRLSKEFADQIVEQLNQLFDPNETDSSWHGGCLALAELCRRGLLLPERLEQYVPILDKALVYDINRGNFSVGSHVRDAACYVVWSFARAYSPEIMKPHVHLLSNQLIVESLFDREVNCRRAASATFQESVGRQGNFPHGIEILTEADYFTLSNRVNAYLNVSCFVAQFPEYFEKIVEHLAFIKLVHWEPQIRMLAAQSLSVISVFNPDYVVKEILPKLVELCYDKALHIRHGAILGVGEILVGLSGNSLINRKEVLERAFKTLSLKERKIIEDSDNQKEFKNRYTQLSTKDYLPESMPNESDIRASVKQITTKVEKLRLYRGKGGEIMRVGVCHLIYSMSLAKIGFNEEERFQLFKTLQENFKHPNIEIQEEATKAFGAFCKTYLDNPDCKEDSKILNEIKIMLKTSTHDENIAITRGYNMSFGELSHTLITKLGQDIFTTLLHNSVPKGKEQDDAETRKYSVASTISIVQTLGVKNIDKEILKNILETFYRCMSDYQVDRRGDVGSWVREESMLGLMKFFKLVVDSNDQEIIQYLKADQPKYYERFVSTLIQQLMEKIDKVREIAGRSLQKFFKFVSPSVIEFSEKERLTALFVSHDLIGVANETITYDDGIAYLPWRSAEFVFSSIRPFFDSDIYALSIFKGLITSSGGLTESTLKASSNSLFEYLSDLNKNSENCLTQKKRFLGLIITLFEQNLKDERVTIPLMKTIEMLLTSDYLQEQDLIEDLIRIHSLTVMEVNKSKNMVKLMSAAGVYSGMFSYSNHELCQKAIKSMLFLLYHSFPKIRKLSAEKLYTCLLSMEDFSLIIPNGEDAYDRAIEMLSETNWIDQLKDISQNKETMYSFFGLTVSKPTGSVEESKKEDIEMIKT